VSNLYRNYYIKKQQQQRGGGNGQFGQIYQGQRFPNNRLQDGSGLGSLLGTVARGIANLIQRTPSWVKTGAKLAGQSALKGMSEYAGDVEAGIPRDVARKRAIKSSLGNMLVQSGEKLKRGGGGGKRKVQKGGKKCCKLKMLQRQQTGVGGRRRRPKKPQNKKKKKKATARGKRRRRQPAATGIKRRGKFDLFSV
jgi:hypothetical protein